MIMMGIKEQNSVEVPRLKTADAISVGKLYRKRYFRARMTPLMKEEAAHNFSIFGAPTRRDTLSTQSPISVARVPAYLSA
jgi:hypothetical protein